MRVTGGTPIEKGLPIDGETVQSIVTSPPYWGQRDYGYDEQAGVEETYVEYLEWWRSAVQEMHRVVKSDGTAWVVVGDTYNTRTAIRPSAHQAGLGHTTTSTASSWSGHRYVRYSARQEGMVDKDLMGLPWRMAEVARDVGWIVRCDVIWSKPWGSPENAPDRPARSHENVFLLARSKIAKFRRTPYINANRSVWTIAPRSDRTGPASFPDELVARCLEATTDPGDLVLDPFGGSGATVRVAEGMRRAGIAFDAAPQSIVDRWAAP